MSEHIHHKTTNAWHDSASSSTFSTGKKYPGEKRSLTWVHTLPLLPKSEPHPNKRLFPTHSRCSLERALRVELRPRKSKARAGRGGGRKDPSAEAAGSGTIRDTAGRPTLRPAPLRSAPWATPAPPWPCWSSSHGLNSAPRCGPGRLLSFARECRLSLHRSTRAFPFSSLRGLSPPESHCIPSHPARGSPVPSQPRSAPREARSGDTAAHLRPQSPLQRPSFPPPPRRQSADRKGSWATNQQIANWAAAPLPLLRYENQSRKALLTSGWTSC